MSTSPIICVLGSRPEIQKSIPVLGGLGARTIDASIIFIPQKKDTHAVAMLENSGISFEVVEHLFTKRKDKSIAYLIQAIQEKIQSLGARSVIIAGDTTISVAACLAAKNLGLAIYKIGAGFRLGDFNAAEEKNDILTDHLATHLFCFSAQARENLIHEGIQEKHITLSGSTLIWNIHETLRDQYFRRDYQGRIMISLHRRSNIENKSVMRAIFRTMTQGKLMASFIAHRDHLPVRPPRSKYVMAHHTSLSYDSFIRQLVQAKCIITDSHTIAEEACYLGVPCITIADRTNRPETVEIKANIVIAPSDNQKLFREELQRALYQSVRKKRAWKFPYGDLKTSMMIVNKIADTK